MNIIIFLVFYFLFLFFFKRTRPCFIINIVDYCSSFLVVCCFFRTRNEIMFDKYSWLSFPISSCFRTRNKTTLITIHVSCPFFFVSYFLLLFPVLCFSLHVSSFFRISNDTMFNNYYCFLLPFSYLISCFMFPVSYFNFLVFCFMFHVSCFLFPVSCFPFPVSCFLFPFFFFLF